MNDKIAFAILGYGNIGKRYAKIISRLPVAKLVAIADTDFEHAQPAGAIPWFTSLAGLFQSSIICDVVIIATPNGVHVQHTAECIQAGKHVLVEKPVAFKLSEIEQLIKAAEKNNRLIFPVWQIRYSPLISALKRLISEGALGSIFWMQGDCFWNRGQAYYHNHPWHGRLDMDGGPLFTQFSHVVDIFAWFCNDIVVQDASFYKIRSELKTEFEDSGIVNFKLKDNGVALLSYTTSAPHGTSSNELTIITERAKIKLSGKYFDQLVHLQTDDNKIRSALTSSAQEPVKDIAAYCSETLINEVVSLIVSKIAADTSVALKTATGIIEKIYKQR